MDVQIAVDTLFFVIAIAVLTPMVLGLLPFLRVPQVVLLLLGGILIGPHVLHIGTAESVQFLADVGLGFVFLLAGYEVDLHLFREDPGRRAVVAWCISITLALAIVGLLRHGGLVRAFTPVAIGLTTTSLGTLLPILREASMLQGRFGRYLLAAGAVGEMLPVVAIALFLGVQSRFVALASLAAVGLFGLVLSVLPRGVRPEARLRRVITEGQNATTQTTLRGTMLLLVALIALTDQFHLDAVLGAFVAGMVLRRWAGASAPALEYKLDIIGYGFFIPVFFVYSGMRLDLPSIAAAPQRLLLFLGLMLAVRGLPNLLVYRSVMTLRERVQTGLIASTALPLLVALTEIGLRNGTMLRENAAALVGAGMVSVLVLPAVAITLRRPGSGEPIPSRPSRPARRTSGRAT